MEGWINNRLTSSSINKALQLTQKSMVPTFKNLIIWKGSDNVRKHVPATARSIVECDQSKA